MIKLLYWHIFPVCFISFSSLPLTDVITGFLQESHMAVGTGFGQLFRGIGMLLFLSPSHTLIAFT